MPRRLLPPPLLGALLSLAACVPSREPAADGGEDVSADEGDATADAATSPAAAKTDAGADQDGPGADDAGAGDGNDASPDTDAAAPDAGPGDAGACGACPAERPHCFLGACAECSLDEQCPGVCFGGVCAQCRKSAECPTATASRCSAGSCVACNDDNDCAHLTGLSVCDGGECVECTADNQQTCGLAPAGGRYVCDVQARTCSTETAGSANLCQPCVSDRQCQDGQLCVLQSYDEPNDSPDQGPQPVGYFCFWREDATGAGAPAGTCANSRPFFDTLADSQSIEGVEATVCGLRVTTCPAYFDYSSKSCSGLGDNAACGDPRFEGDALCEEAATSTFRCTTPCGSSDDCKPGFSCTATAQNYCEL